MNVVYLYEDWSRFRINRIAKKSNYIEEEKKRLFMYFDDQQLVNNHVLSDKIKNNGVVSVDKGMYIEDRD